jgi:hypothetical protein
MKFEESYSIVERQHFGDVTFSVVAKKLRVVHVKYVPYQNIPSGITQTEYNIGFSFVNPDRACVLFDKVDGVLKFRFRGHPEDDRVIQEIVDHIYTTEDKDSLIGLTNYVADV